jgi:chorismate mutase/prephenate dehydrogenase
MTEEELHHLRMEIETVDREIFHLLGRRLSLAHQIGELKIATGLPLRDFRVETEVISRAERFSREVGLEPALGRELVRVLLQGSLKVQEDLREKSHRGELRRVVVVGGTGKMGTWLCHFLHGQGHRVTVADPAGPLEGFPHVRDAAKAPAETEVFVLAVPMSAAPDVYRHLIEHAGDPLIIDMLSLKSPVIETIRKGVARGKRIASLHPMFGPGVHLLSGRILAICDCGCPVAASEARDLFAGTSLDIEEVGLEEHDEIMAIVLGLSHALSIIFFHALQLSGNPFPRLQQFASTTFGKQVATATEVAEENPDLFYEIQHLNPHTERVLDLLIRASRQVKERALNGDRGSFVNLMRTGYSYLMEGSGD